LGVSEETILLGTLGADSILKITASHVDSLRESYFEKFKRKIFMVIGGNGSLSVMLPALIKSEYAVMMSQAITDNGGRTGKQEKELRLGKGPTIGFGDEAGAVCDGFLPDTFMCRKIFSNFNASEKREDVPT